MKKRAHPEQDLQQAVMALLRRHARPEIIFTATANGDLRNKVVAVRLKHMGVLPGVPDICICLDGGMTGWLELKSKNGRLSPEQQGFGVKVMKLGHYWAVARTMQEAVYTLVDWDVFKPTANLREWRIKGT